MLNYKEFKERLLLEAEAYIPPKYTILIKDLNSSDTPNEIFYMTEKSHDPMGTAFIYVRELYKEYLDSDNITKVVSNAVKSLLNETKELEYINSYDINENIILALINYENNKELLKILPHKRFLDLAIVFKYTFLLNESKKDSMYLADVTFDILGYDFDTLYEKAKINTSRLMPHKTEKLIDYLNYTPMQEDMGNVITLTNESGSGGAVYMLYPEILQDIKEKTGEPFYIIPSSIHELLIIPVSAADPDFLKRTINEVNSSIVKRKDFLSNNLYLYDMEVTIV